MNHVIVTGREVLSTAGFTMDEFWHTLYDGKGDLTSAR